MPKKKGHMLGSRFVGTGESQKDGAIKTLSRMARNVLKHARADVSRTEKQLGMIFRALEPHVSGEEFEKFCTEVGLRPVEGQGDELAFTLASRT